MDPQKYLLRIGCNAVPTRQTPTLDTLRRVHRCHLMAVPFENLTIHSQGRVLLALPDLYHKIVVRHRGGFCFENNGLFSWLLTEMGFDVTILSGQVKNAITGRYGPPFDHLISMVTLGGQRWLCDVGFGGAGFEFPISLETAELQKQGHRMYRIRQEGKMHFLEWQDEERSETGIWAELYKFTLNPQSREDFTEMCNYHQSSPSSIFFCKSLCSILKPNGRLTYMGHRLITSHFPSGESGNVTKTVRELTDEDIPDILKEDFGIELDFPLVPKDEAITPPTIMY
uniref:arylamine N-acetyltransferase n=1 Tax=Esox lucius TaxID=8010 RepID=A0AAY5K9F9_ESOLU